MSISRGKKWIEWSCINDNCVSNGKGVRVAFSHSFGIVKRIMHEIMIAFLIFPGFEFFSSATCQESKVCCISGNIFLIEDI